MLTFASQQAVLIWQQQQQQQQAMGNVAMSSVGVAQSVAGLGELQQAGPAGSFVLSAARGFGSSLSLHEQGGGGGATLQVRMALHVVAFESFAGTGTDASTAEEHERRWQRWGERGLQRRQPHAATAAL